MIRNLLATTSCNTLCCHQRPLRASLNPPLLQTAAQRLLSVTLLPRLGSTLYIIPVKKKVTLDICC